MKLTQNTADGIAQNDIFMYGFILFYVLGILASHMIAGNAKMINNGKTLKRINMS